MKKIVVLVAIMMLAAGSAFATTFNENGTTASVSGVLSSYKTSKNVEVHAKGDKSTYAARSKHLNGDREYGSAAGDSKLYYQDSTVGATASDPTNSDSSEFSSWTAL